MKKNYKKRPRLLSSLLKRAAHRIDESWANNSTHEESRRPTSFELLLAQESGLNDIEEVLSIG